MSKVESLAKLNEPKQSAELKQLELLEHFGAPFQEQKELLAGRALCPLPEYGVLEVTGADRFTWLNSLLSQKIDDLAAGASAVALNLDVQGRICQQIAVVNSCPAVDSSAEVSDCAGPDTPSIFLLCESGCADLEQYLLARRFMLQVEVKNRADLAVVGFNAAAFTDVFAGVTARLRKAGVDARAYWVDPWPQITPGGTTYWWEQEAELVSASQDLAGALVANVARHPATGAGFTAGLQIVARPDLERLVAGTAPGLSCNLSASPVAGFSWAGRSAWRALCIAAWRPGASELDDRVLPAELDLTRVAVHLHKGCYRGQESVARIFNLGKPPRRLVFLDLDGYESLLPLSGDAIYYQGRKVGHITSSALHFEDGPIALALVSRALPEDVELTVEVTEERTTGVQSAKTSAIKEQNVAAEPKPCIAAGQTPIVRSLGRAFAAPLSRPGAGLGHKLSAR